VREFSLEHLKKSKSNSSTLTSLISIPLDPKAGVASDAEIGVLDKGKGVALVAADRKKNEFLAYLYALCCPTGLYL
jgi:hypothetical protein